MQDRIPLYPGRVKLTPVSGQENTYDMVRADEPTQVGTALSKANLLTDAVAAQFGLDGVVPNDIFAWLGKYNEHWWSLLHGEAYSYYEEKRTKITNRVKLQANSPADGWTISYSKSISINQSTGAVSLVNPTSMPFSAISTGLKIVQTITQQAPCYMYANCYSGKFGPYYIPAGATYREYPGNVGGPTTFTQDTDGTNAGYAQVYINETATESIRASTVSSHIVAVPAGETTYEHSTDRNAYPDSGTVDDITYNYLGVPFEKFPTVTRIETGRYTGTGTYGSANPNSLTFSHKPLLVVIPETTIIAVNPHSRATALASNSYYSVVCTWDSNIFKWYTTSNNTNAQANYSGYTYHYFAITE